MLLDRPMAPPSADPVPSGSAPVPLGGKLFQGVDRQSRAFKLMQQMVRTFCYIANSSLSRADANNQVEVDSQGWEEGRGLGKQQQGIATHVRVKVKADSEGETSI